MQRNSALCFEIYVGIRVSCKSFLSSRTQWIFEIEYAFGILFAHGRREWKRKRGEDRPAGRRRLEGLRNEPWRIEVPEKNLKCRERQ